MGYERCSGCPILQTESADPATRTTEAKVHRLIHTRAYTDTPDYFSVLHQFLLFFKSNGFCATGHPSHILLCGWYLLSLDLPLWSIWTTYKLPLAASNETEFIWRRKDHFFCECVDAKGIHISSSAAEAIQKVPRPRNVWEIWAFLGLLNYYQKCMWNLANILHPLNRLLRTGYSELWTVKRNQLVPLCLCTIYFKATAYHGCRCFGIWCRCYLCTMLPWWLREANSIYHPYPNCNREELCPGGKRGLRNHLWHPDTSQIPLWLNFYLGHRPPTLDHNPGTQERNFSVGCSSSSTMGYLYTAMKFSSSQPGQCISISMQCWCIVLVALVESRSIHRVTWCRNV